MGFQNFENEIKINIFKRVSSPLNLALTCRNWSKIIEDSQAKAEWLLVKYGKYHALFHAVRLGPFFIDIPVCRTLIKKKVLISRYFIQKLLMHFGKRDQRLIQLNIGLDVTHNFQQTSWAGDLPISVFTYLLDEGYKQLSNTDDELPLKGNDMELFHFLSAGPHAINYAPRILRSNLKIIEDLILNKQFIPFPPRPKSLQLYLNSDPHIRQQPIPEEYPPRDGYENNRQLNVIARGILIHSNLVNLWKKIGYHEICDNVNDLVMQGALLILFPPIPSSDWSCPTCDTVTSRLMELINLGFKLQDNVIINAIHTFEHRLNEIGNILWDAFITIRNSGQLDSLALKFYNEAFKPERNLEKDDLLNFLKSKFDFHERVVEQVIKQYFIEEKMSDIVLRRKSLILSPNIYKYILSTYGNRSKSASMCFEDILLLRTYIDVTQVSEMSTFTLDSITSTFDLYVKAEVEFNPEYHLGLLPKVTSLEIIKPFFNFLFSVFGMNPTPKVSRTRKSNNSKKRKKPCDGLITQWVGKLYSLKMENNEKFSNIFKENFTNFLRRLSDETTYQIDGVVMNNYYQDSDYQESEPKRLKK